MTCRVRAADSHHVTALCKSLLAVGLDSERVRYLASGRYSDCFIIRTGNTREVVAKVSTYREGCLRAIARAMQGGDYDKGRRILSGDAVCISNRLAAITNLLLSQCVTPHLVWSFGEFDCKGFLQQASRTRLAPPVRKRLKELQKEGSKLQSLYSNISFHERFKQDLTDFLQDNQVTTYCLKCIIFQVVFTVGCLQHLMPGFRHNDLSTNNVFINDLETTVQACDQYDLEDITMYTCVPNILVAVADWDFAHCQDPVFLTGAEVNLRNERVVSGAYNLKPRPNPTYDVHFFLTTLLQQLQGKPRTHADVITFLRRVTGKWSDRCDIMLPRLEPVTLLHHHFFDELREPPGCPVREVYGITTPHLPHFQQALDPCTV